MPRLPQVERQIEKGLKSWLDHNLDALPNACLCMRCRGFGELIVNNRVRAIRFLAEIKVSRKEPAKC